MKLYMHSLLILLLFSVACKKAKTDSNVVASLKSDVYALAHDSMMGRETGTKGEEMAAKYIANRMESIGLSPKGEEGFFQEFSRKATYNPHSEVAEGTEIKGKNVIGFLDNKKDKTIVIGAHYDHLGLGGEGSLHDKKGEIHNGADDNASGVAVMLSLAENLQGKQHNFLFIAFSGEEKGLWGSNYFVKNPTLDLEEVSMMINMDMVGMLDSNNRLAVHGVGTSPSFVSVVNGIENHPFKIKMDSSGIGPSDHTSFYNDSIPVLHFFTGQHKHYHKPTDDVERLNYEGMLQVKKFILAIINKLDPIDKVAFIKTKDKKTKSRSFKVTLGVMPDYLFDGEGLKIDGVKEDRPASKAGIQKGDILTMLNGKEIKTIHDYMDVISGDLQGKKVQGKVFREGKELLVEIEF